MKELTLTTAAGMILTLRFDLGTARIFKELTNVDLVAGDKTDANGKAAENIYLAAYKRACKIYKKPQELSDEQVIDTYDELSMEEAVKVVELFTAALTVKSDKAQEVKTDSLGDLKDEVKNL